MSIALVIEILQKAASAGIDLYTVWKKANASIEYDGTVNKDAYNELVKFCDNQIDLLKKNAEEAGNG
jgi:hypothetical protein